jgi:hypothetical protein
MHDPGLLKRYTFDPFILPIQDLQDADTGLHPLTPAARTRRIHSLLEDEAQELAWGLRHLTIVHGQPRDLADEDLIGELHEDLHELLAAAEWTRLSGLADYLTISVAGDLVDHWIDLATQFATRRNPGHWHILDTARPSTSS